MTLWCETHQRFFDPREGCLLCMSELATERINKIMLLKALVEDWLPQIGMTITFREMFYEILDKPNPEWLGERQLTNVELKWIDENHKLVEQGVRQ